MTSFEAVYASPWRRFWALTLDVMLLWITASLIATASGSALAWACYAVLYVGWDITSATMGGSPGKRALGLRITQTDGSYPGLGSACARWLMRICSLIPFGAGCWWMLDSPTAQTWHDVVAGTIVIHERRIDAGPSWRTRPPWAEPAQEQAAEPS